MRRVILHQCVSSPLDKLLEIELDKLHRPRPSRSKYVFMNGLDAIEQYELFVENKFLYRLHIELSLLKVLN